MTSHASSCTSDVFSMIVGVHDFLLTNGTENCIYSLVLHVSRSTLQLNRGGSIDAKGAYRTPDLSKTGIVLATNRVAGGISPILSSIS